MKYVVIQVPLGKELLREIPVIFPNEIVHLDIAKTLIAMCPGFEKGKAVSAGFVNSMDIDAPLHGKSDSLKLITRDEDKSLVQMNDYLHGIKDRD